MLFSPLSILHPRRFWLNAEKAFDCTEWNYLCDTLRLVLGRSSLVGLSFYNLPLLPPSTLMISCPLTSSCSVEQDRVAPRSRTEDFSLFWWHHTFISKFKYLRSTVTQRYANLFREEELYTSAGLCQVRFHTVVLFSSVLNRVRFRVRC